MPAYNIKIKGSDGKYVTLGNVREGKFGGVQVGLKATAELAEAIASLTARDGRWVNLSILPDDGNRGRDRAIPPRPGASLDDEIPF